MEQPPAYQKNYSSYPKAIHLLTQKLSATPEELALWIWLGPERELGGIAAYTHANELEPPPRFYFILEEYGYPFDYVKPLAGCWFLEQDVVNFQPADRYLTGKQLRERWKDRLDEFDAFIEAKILASQLTDLHPILGGVYGVSVPDGEPPTLDVALFGLSEIETVELNELNFDTHLKQPNHPQLGTSEWRKQNASKAASALHDKPGGSRDKQQQIRDIWAKGRYSTRDICAEQECAALNMSFSAARKALSIRKLGAV